MVRVQAVQKGSAADRSGVRAGDFLLTVNGHEIEDVLDYRFYLAETDVTLRLHRGPDILECRIRKDEYEDIGLDFETFLMDRKHSCRNGCVFCFIDQNPKGMRDTIYFKDDDSRMSFLMGNYVTLTNMSEREISRIIEMRMSPINISVHTTNPELRVKMMKNRFAGSILDTMRRFAAAGIGMNAQLVICKGLNDGAELQRSMEDLEPLFPALQSVAVVPAGLTCHREGLYPLESFTAEDSRRIIAQVNAFGDRCLEIYGCRLFYVADETYVKAGLALPDASYYDGYPQLDNGVGLMTSMEEEFLDELSALEDYDTVTPRRISLATGSAAYGYICRLTALLMEKVPTLDCRVYRIDNNFFGQSVTVAGLVCGGDLLAQLQGKDLGERLFLPEVMVRDEGDLFLDGVPLAHVSEKLGVPITLCNNDGGNFVRQILYKKA